MLSDGGIGGFSGKTEPGGQRLVVRRGILLTEQHVEHGSDPVGFSDQAIVIHVWRQAAAEPGPPWQGIPLGRMLRESEPDAPSVPLRTIATAGPIELSAIPAS